MAADVDRPHVLVQLRIDSHGGAAPRSRAGRARPLRELPSRDPPRRVARPASQPALARVLCRLPRWGDGGARRAPSRGQAPARRPQAGSDRLNPHAEYHRYVPAAASAARTAGRTGALRLRWPAGIALGAYVLIAFLYFGLRALGHAGRTYIGTPNGDPQLEIWAFGWWPHAILNGHNPFYTHAIWAP